MPDSKFDLGDYVGVKDRIKLFYELYGQGRLETFRYELTREPDDKPKVIVEAAAYRSPEDEHPGRGLSWMYLPGTTNYTKGSELENTETSAWGRAIAALGILVDRSIASGDEVRAKAGEPAAEKLGQEDGSLIGTVEVGKPSAKTDLELRETPDGHVIGFRLVSPKGGIKVLAFDPLASALAVISPTIIGQRVQCWGKVRDETFRPKGSTKDVVYQLLILEKIAGPDFILPADIPDELPPIDEDAEAELDAILA